MDSTSEVSQVNDVDWIRTALHDLAQPITALECGLFLGTMSPDGVELPKVEDLLATIRLALVQCERASGQLRLMQERINSL